MLKLSQHKNALIGGILGGVGGGQLVVELLDQYTNLHLDAREGALVAGGVATIVLFAGRAAKYVLAHGVAGAWHRILHGAEAGGGTHAVATPPGTATLPEGAQLAAQLVAGQSALEQRLARLERAAVAPVDARDVSLVDELEHAAPAPLAPPPDAA